MKSNKHDRIDATTVGSCLYVMLLVILRIFKTKCKKKETYKSNF